VPAPSSPPQPIPNSYWLADGELLAGGYPGSSDPASARAKLRAFLDAGIRSFIDLTESHELPPYDDVLREIARERKVEVTYERVSIRNLGIPTRQVMDEILASIRAHAAAGRPVYVHCWGGIGRTGTVAGCWLVDHGSSCDEALGRIRALRAETPDGWQRSPETDAQRSFVRAWS
jgi:protein-tyrosine phosphatase